MSNGTAKRVQQEASTGTNMDVINSVLESTGTTVLAPPPKGSPEIEAADRFLQSRKNVIDGLLASKHRLVVEMAAIDSRLVQFGEPSTEAAVLAPKKAPKMEVLPSGVKLTKSGEIDKRSLRKQQRLAGETPAKVVTKGAKRGPKGKGGINKSALIRELMEKHQDKSGDKRGMQLKQINELAAALSTPVPAQNVASALQSWTKAKKAVYTKGEMKGGRGGFYRLVV